MPKADNLLPFCAVLANSGNLNFLEPSGPLWACNGTALPWTSYSEFSRCTPLLQAYAGIVPSIRTTAIFHLYFQASTRKINYPFQLFVAVSFELLKSSLNEPQAEINYELRGCGLIT